MEMPVSMVHQTRIWAQEYTLGIDEKTLEVRTVEVHQQATVGDASPCWPELLNQIPPDQGHRQRQPQMGRMTRVNATKAICPQKQPHAVDPARAKNAIALENRTSARASARETNAVSAQRTWVATSGGDAGVDTRPPPKSRRKKTPGKDAIV